MTGFGSGFHWIPVWLGFGAGFYFAASSEPSIARPLLVAAGLLAPWLFLRFNDSAPFFRAGAGIAGTIALGFVFSVLRAQDVAAPVLTKQTGPLDVTGRVEDVERFSEKDGRILLRDVAFPGRSLPRAPKKIRLRIRGPQPGIIPGDVVEAAVILTPLRPPDRPGGFDYPRFAYFQALGASGFTIAPLKATRSGTGAWRIRLNRLRDQAARRIGTVLPGDEGAFLAAILVGRRDGLSDTAQDNLRQSGLTHILSISGLHMSMIALSVFMAFRAFLAAVPPLARACDVRYVAAFAAIAAVTGYFLLSDLSVPPVRSWIMVTLGFAAIILLRRPVSLRIVSIAGIVILAVTPEALIEPSFQMSFAATIALISAYRGYARWRLRKAGREGLKEQPFLIWALGAPFRHMAGMVATTLIASAATAPFSIFHFGKASLFGIGANAVAVPLMGLYLMPLGFLSLLLMPFGWDAPVLAVLKPGLSFALETAAYFADGQSGMVAVPSFPPEVLGFIAFGGMALCLALRWPQRCIAIVLMFSGIVWASRTRQPDLFVSPSGAAAWVDDHGNLVAGSGTRANLARKSWASSLAAREVKLAARSHGREAGICDGKGCWFMLRGRRVAIVRDFDALIEDCETAAFLINLTAGPAPCRRIGENTIDKALLRENGAYAVRFFQSGPPVATSVAASRGVRPWTAPWRFGLSFQPGRRGEIGGVAAGPYPRPTQRDSFNNQ